MQFLWDPVKQRSNLRKHKIEFADAAVALEDKNALTILDNESQNEYRYLTLCIGSIPDVLMVVHTEEVEGLITIISARLADPAEHKQYYEGITYGN